MAKKKKVEDPNAEQGRIVMAGGLIFMKDDDILDRPQRVRSQLKVIKRPGKKLS